ncbi:hypothetical protein AGDE_14611 [Angomonas deanei]|uniref:Peptidase family M49, putative n=1 Tax=Angomonas deanei TaxID=59799 RepID=A0A7G2CTP2_9TRYP|nr:hypothetical protein AGDE_14611 [Angomonas deanei]CAD2222431.1 Peptidase family M49, putative [Angomonas deanei]|eukprot:EPY20546.1 hypothetical protein AGDE_14611 [Angomonas deanei]
MITTTIHPHLSLPYLASSLFLVLLLLLFMASLHVTPRGIPFCPLTVAKAFKDMTKQQQHYAYYMMRAGWQGTPVVARQLSPESLPLLKLFHEILSAKESIPLFKSTVLQQQPSLKEDEVDQFLEYAALLYCNMGNYLSFGDSKFIPSCNKDVFRTILKSVKPDVEETLIDQAYDLAESKLSLNYPPKGISAYYSENITEADAVLANEFLSSKKMEGVNTRVWKSVEGDQVTLTIRIASARKKELPAESFKGVSIVLSYGDHAEEMQKVVQELQNALPYVENDTQKRMLEHYIRHFEDGGCGGAQTFAKRVGEGLGPGGGDEYWFYRILPRPVWCAQ